MLYIKTIYKSIVGEGLDIGMPAVFIELNEDCLDSEAEDAPKKMTFMEVVEQVKKYDDISAVFIIGGEPFVQDIKDIDWLIYELKGEGYFISIETNGIFFPDLKHGKLTDRICVCPELINTNPEAKAQAKTLKKYLEIYSHKFYLKFSIKDKIDFMETIGALNNIENLREHNIPVVIQPSLVDILPKDKDKIGSRLNDLAMLALIDYTRNMNKYKIRLITPNYNIERYEAQ